MKKTLLAAVRVAIGASLIGYLVHSGAFQPAALLRLVTQWPITLMALAVLTADVAMTAWRLCLLLRPVGFVLPLGASMRLGLIGMFFSLFLPGGGGGDLVRFYYALRGNEGRRLELGTILFLDRAIGLFALLVWPLLATPFFIGLVAGQPVLQSLLGAACLAALGLAAAAALAFRTPNGRLARLPFGPYLERMLATVRLYGTRKGALAAAVTVSLAAHTLAIIVMLLVARAMHPEAFDWRMSLLLPLGALANALPLTPGGLGVGEAAMNTLFALADLAGGADILLGWRLLLVVIGLAGLAFYLQGSRRLVHARRETAPRRQEAVG